MEASEKIQDELLVAVRKHYAMVKVNGRVSFRAGPSLKRFGVSAIERGCTQIVFDMEGCLGMDSTFMGVLAGLAFRVRRETNGRMIAINLSPKTALLLDTLGLDRLVECYEVGKQPDALEACLVNVLDLEGLEAVDEGKRVSLETMLEAHQNLVEISSENVTRFRDVITYLDQDRKELDGQ